MPNRRIQNRGILYLQPTVLTIPRHRKAHKKSRDGCANCRFRKVKCGEEKPECRKCQNYRIPCRYDAKTAEMLSLDESIISDFVSTNGDIHSSKASFTARGQCTTQDYAPSLLDLNHATILRFRSRTALTLGTPETVQIYAEEVPRLALQYDFLLHAVCATTMLHDRSFSGRSQTTPDEAYHLSRAAALFNRKLSGQVSDNDRDALWATAIYLCALSIFDVGTTDPEQAWPLGKSNDADLRWLDLQFGLRMMWKLTNVARSDGPFGGLEQHEQGNCVFPAAPVPGIKGLPALLISLCRLTENSTPGNHPYHAAVHYLSWLLPVESTPANTLTFLIFAGGMTRAFRTLLQNKDTRALLLLSVWYAKLFTATWWMAPRAIVECKSICMYLKRRKSAGKAFSHILDVVRLACSELDGSTVVSILNDPQPSCLKVRDGPISMATDMFWL